MYPELSYEDSRLAHTENYAVKLQGDLYSDLSLEAEDEVYVDAIRRMDAAQDAAVFEAAELLGYLAQPERPEQLRAALAHEFILFLNNRQTPAVTEEARMLLGILDEASEDRFIPILQQAVHSDVYATNLWLARLATVLLHSQHSEIRRQHDNSLITNGKNFFGALRLYADQISRR